MSMMKKIVIGLSIILVIGLIITITIGVVKTMKVENEKKEKERIIAAYAELHYAFEMSSGKTLMYKLDGEYRPFPTLSEEDNRFGINPYIYIVVGFYNKETGKDLTYDRVVEYFSKEYETDGSLRLYNNGLNPDIERYVVWAQDNKEGMKEYRYKLQGLYSEYLHNNRDKGFEVQAQYNLSPQMLDELIKKEANPDYEMDLLSLQEQGY